jgi:ectoine hydroxylase-related dioxygenase (phytanoyl-CoA dioxygenase family)
MTAAVDAATVLGKSTLCARSYARYQVACAQYENYRRTGFLVVPALVPPEDIAELKQHTEDLMHGRLPEQTLPDKKGAGHLALEAPPKDLPPEEKAQFFLRIHMLHRKLELHERYMLHPRVLDVLECLIGPDVLALQTMLFLKPPGKPGQGWHQDTYYIPTHPDTLVGAWICVDDCDELNGAMWMASGSGSEPVYPPAKDIWFGQKNIADIKYVNGVSDVDDAKNDLSKIADKYPQILVSAKAGDVVFFNGHILHRSKQNYTKDRFRRSFVSHYCNARSFTQWGADSPRNDPHAAPCVEPATGMTNGSHILARGNTHLPFALPRFGTPCAALLPLEERKKQSEYAAAAMGDMASGMMGPAPAKPDIKH